ncbi:thioredoxin domain-containing protein [Nesterenkonia haasae]|uniref:thioredoxin domain-containing protein n=1 Tax=Nesterenkonia haasae TaxID=2587813 RepID=UPI0013918ED3|nr:DUF255 domain-containing protein [Nesterenkonia haasae]NDK31041.1 thioredoxin domain-containing protein [Nesterenkonia haasae]
MAQRLINAQSAYLRQHADNPVDWWPWGSEAFAEAARRDTPVFVSIGYAACHWCHVMAHESFEDQRVAAYLNERFVSIKVDREEHPDVDDAYMAATQAMTGQGGWPMSIFALPDGQVFHAGTYFPPQRVGQVPSFTEVLQAVYEAWDQRRGQVEEQAATIAKALNQQRQRQAQMATVVHTSDDGAPASELDQERFDGLTGQILEALIADEDTVHGGFGSAPKFPPSPVLTWLLEESAWALREEAPDGSGGPDRAGGLAVHTLEAMARSALFDHVEGGFARYATDRAWQLPHFEKMLSDNAQLLGAYARLSRHPAADADVRARAKRVAETTVEWLRHRMCTEQGLLASSLDADTVDAQGHRSEGATYLFSDEQLVQAATSAGLSPSQARQLARLNQGVPADEHALRSGAPLNITEATPRTVHFDEPLTEDDRTLWEAALPELRSIRAERAQPARDDKVVAAWNAQAIRSLAEAAMIWDDVETLGFAEQLAERLWAVHTEAGPSGTRVYRTSYDGARGQKIGTLADHAHTVNACFSLASALAGSGREATWVDRGRQVLDYTLSSAVVRHGDEVTWSLADSFEAMAAPGQSGPQLASPVDGPEPSSVAALAQALQAAAALQQPAGEISTEDILHHVPLIGPQAPLAVSGSLLAARRVAAGSAAFRILSGTAADISEAKKVGALLGIPVEPLGDGVVIGSAQPLTLSLCLSGAGGGVCLAPVSSIGEALSAIR